MNSVHIVQHLHLLPSGEEDVKLIGAYASRAAALAAIQRLQVQPGFRDHSTLVDAAMATDPQGFYVDEYLIDQDHWSEGYETVWP